MTKSTENNNNELSENIQLDTSKQLVEDLFKNVSENNKVPESFKTIILKLKSPYLKIATDTPNLFAFENHQARILLNCICKQAVESLDLEDSDNKFLQKVESIVSQISGFVEYNNNKFIYFQKDLEKSLETLKKRALIKLKRKQELLLAQKKVAQAKSQTSQIIAEKLSSAPNTPEFIKQVLQNEWTSVLELVHIRNGAESELYKSELNFIDLLLNIVTKPESQESNRQEYKSLFEIYHKGLSLFIFNKQEVKQKASKLFEFIKSFHQLQNTKSSSNNTAEVSQEDIKISNQQNEKTTSEQYPSNKIEAKVNDENKTKDLELDYSVIVDSLNKNSWFELIKADGSPIKAKLSWVSPVSGSHLFVDSQGLKIANKTKSELIQGLMDNSIKIIN